MYYKNDLHASTSQIRGHLPLLSDKNSVSQLREKQESKGKEVHEFYFRLKLGLHPYFHATCASII